MELVEADLLKPETWPAAIDGCTYVCHVASPFVFGVSEADEDTLIKPAVDGTLNVLRPCMTDKVRCFLANLTGVVNTTAQSYSRFLLCWNLCAVCTIVGYSTFEARVATPAVSSKDGYHTAVRRKPRSHPARQQQQNNEDPAAVWAHYAITPSAESLEHAL